MDQAIDAALVKILTDGMRYYRLLKEDLKALHEAIQARDVQKINEAIEKMAQDMQEGAAVVSSIPALHEFVANTGPDMMRKEAHEDQDFDHKLKDVELMMRRIAAKVNREVNGPIMD